MQPSIFSGSLRDSNYANSGGGVKSKNPSIDPLRDLTANNASMAGQYGAFQNTYANPQFQDTLRKLVESLSNSNYENQANRAAGSSTAIYGQQARNNALQGQRMGLGTATSLGLGNAASGLATRQASAAAEQYRDPRRQQQDLMSAVQLLAQAMQTNPYFADLLQGGQFLEQHNMNSAQKKAQGGIGGVLGQLAGNVIGSGALNKVLKF